MTAPRTRATGANVRSTGRANGQSAAVCRWWPELPSRRRTPLARRTRDERTGPPVEGLDVERVLRMGDSRPGELSTLRQPGRASPREILGVIEQRDNPPR